MRLFAPIAPVTLLTVLALLPSAGFASPPPECRRQTNRLLAATKLLTETAREFWSRESPIRIQGPKGESDPLTFSFDAEIPFQHLIEALQKTPEGINLLKRVFNKKTVMKDWSMFGSPAFIRSFVLKRPVRDTQTEFGIWDVNPAYAAGYSVWMESRVALVREVMADSGKYLGSVPHFSNAGIDGGQLELRHRSWDIVPKEYLEKEIQLYSTYKNPQVHMHLGVPSWVGTDNAFAIYWAVNTKLRLEILVGNPDYNDMQGPIVQLEPDRFTQPTQMHDIEIRQAFSSQHQRETLAFAANLATHYQGLRPFKDFKRRVSFGTRLYDVLRHASFMLNEAGHTDVSAKLAHYAKTAEISSDPSLRQEIANYIEENNVLKLLEKSFLKGP